MQVDPEIIPDSSNQGYDALKIASDWKIKSLYFVVLIFSMFILSKIISISLMFLALTFIWRLATKKL